MPYDPRAAYLCIEWYEGEGEIGVSGMRAKVKSAWQANPSMSEEFRAACLQLAGRITECSKLAAKIAANKLALQNRHETIFLCARGGGKTSIGAESPFGGDPPIGTHGGYLDETPGTPPRDTEKLVTAMLRQLRTQRGLLPSYRPKILLRPETWWKIAPRIGTWYELHNVAELSFPVDAFYEALLAGGCSPDAIGTVAPQQQIDRCSDLYGRFLPGIAFDSLVKTINLSLQGVSQARAVWQGYAEAAAGHVQLQHDICSWLLHLVPADKRLYMAGTRLLMPYDRIISRLRSVRAANPGRELPLGLTGPRFIEYLTAAGILEERNKRGMVAWSRPYAIGASWLKSNLTTAAIHATVNS